MNCTRLYRLVLLVAIAHLSLVTGALCQESIFPDKALESAVRKEVFAKRYNEEPITKEDVKNISQVHGKGLGIKSLAGLEHCLAVQEIDLEDNEIVDLAPMAGLKLLLSINLAGNQIESVEPLKELDRVQYLDLSRNKIKDISPLAKMTNMRSLYLSENRIEDISVVKHMPKIWTLYLAGNPVQDFAPISQLKWLSSLDLSHCKLSDLEFLRPLTELKYVNLRNNEIADLSVLVEMAEQDTDRRFAPFWRIYLEGNPLDGEKVQQQIARLKELGARISLDDGKDAS
ncbi:MAG: hypothetical protein D6753_14695 [Planctomycetota bacterium]|nr:MAG: hypothetical protein D6753_14695 [Planctomycetota bacterium]